MGEGGFVKGKVVGDSASHSGNGQTLQRVDDWALQLGFCNK